MRVEVMFNTCLLCNSLLLERTFAEGIALKIIISYLVYLQYCFLVACHLRWNSCQMSTCLWDPASSVLLVITVLQELTESNHTKSSQKVHCEVHFLETQNIELLPKKVMFHWLSESVKEILKKIPTLLHATALAISSHGCCVAGAHFCWSPLKSVIKIG